MEINQHRRVWNEVRFVTISLDQLMNLHQIGKGSFGEVFVAKHKHWGQCAYKRLNAKDNFLDPSYHNRALKEMKAHCQLHHPNITQMMAVVCGPGSELGIVLSYEQYGDAFRFINEFSVDWPWKIKILLCITLGVNYLHTMSPPIVHGDIKIRNILIGDGFIAKLSDFSLCINLLATTLHTFPGGTLTHISPERLKDINAHRSTKSDVYSFGVLIWELFTGKIPYEGNVKELIIDAVRSGKRPDTSFIPENVPSAATEMMERCWEDQPADRPNCSEIVELFDFLCSTYNAEIRRSWHDLCIQADAHLPVQTESQSSCWSLFDAIPGSVLTNPSAPKQVYNSTGPCPSFSHTNVTTDRQPITTPTLNEIHPMPPPRRLPPTPPFSGPPQVQPILTPPMKALPPTLPPRPYSMNGTPLPQPPSNHSATIGVATRVRSSSQLSVASHQAHKSHEVKSSSSSTTGTLKQRVPQLLGKLLVNKAEHKTRQTPQIGLPENFTHCLHYDAEKARELLCDFSMESAADRSYAVLNSSAIYKYDNSFEGDEEDDT